MGRIWVVDQGNDRVQVFDGAGAFLFKFGTSGSGPGQFSGPMAISIDPSNHAWITDQANNRVEEFDENGAFIMQFGSYGSGSGQFAAPTGITVSNPVGSSAGGSGSPGGPGLPGANNAAHAFYYLINPSSGPYSTVGSPVCSQAATSSLLILCL